MTRLSKIAVMRVFRRTRVPDDYAEKPWCYMAPITALSAAIRSEPDTTAAQLSAEVEKMWDAFCRKPSPSNAKCDGAAGGGPNSL